jgi:hypothetical protein
MPGLKPLTRVGAGLAGALSVFLKPKLGADSIDALDLRRVLSGVTRQNFASSKAIINRDIRNQLQGRLRPGASIETLTDLLDACGADDELMGLDQAPHGRGPDGVGCDTEENPGSGPTMPSQAGTSSAASMTPSLDDGIVEDEVDGEGMSVTEQNSPKTGTNLSGEVHLRTVPDQEEYDASVDVNRRIGDAIDVMMDKWATDYGLDRDLMCRHMPTSDRIGGPEPFVGEPLRGGEMRPNRQTLAGDVSVSYSSFDKTATVSYKRRLLEAMRMYHIDPRRPDLAAQRLAADDKLRHASPTATFERSGAGSIGIWNG